jgi:hypothetical protein
MFLFCTVSLVQFWGQKLNNKNFKINASPIFVHFVKILEFVYGGVGQ